MKSIFRFLGVLSPSVLKSKKTFEDLKGKSEAASFLTKEVKNDTTTLVKMLCEKSIVKIGEPTTGADRYFVVPK